MTLDLLYLAAEFVVAVVVVVEVGVVVGVEPSSPATSSAASWVVVAGTSCVDGVGHGAELVGDSLAPPHHHHLLPEEEREDEGENPHHYSAAEGSSEGAPVSYEREWRG